MFENQEPKNIFEILCFVRQNFFLGQKFYMPQDYKFSIVINETDHYKNIEMIKNGKEHAGFPIISFPEEENSPLIHPNNDLILKEFSAKFFILKPLKPGAYFFIKHKNTNTRKTDFVLVKDKERLKGIDLNDAEYEFINNFIKKYGKYSTPGMSEDGNYKFNRPIMYFEKFFSFYIPPSNHELLKGFETNFI